MQRFTVRAWRSTSLSIPLCFAIPVLSLALTACSPRMALMQQAGNALSGQAQQVEDDLVLAREASAFYLKVSESVLREQPGHLALAESVAAGFTQYAYAFVAFEADRVEATDARAAQRLRVRAARLYHRAHQHAMAALNTRHPGFSRALAQSDTSRWPRIEPEEVGLAYWAAASWGGYISLSKDSPDTVADLPLAHRLASRAYATEAAHGEGALAGLMGTFEAARPGGSSSQALAYLDQAITWGQGRQAGAYLSKAEVWAQPKGDRAAFEALLRQSLATAAAHRTLNNEAMRERAEWLLASIDDLF